MATPSRLMNNPHEAAEFAGGLGILFHDFFELGSLFSALKLLFVLDVVSSDIYHSRMGIAGTRKSGAIVPC